jgi:membrane-associated protease RseP (regulator of RpoE activity)
MVIAIPGINPILPVGYAIVGLVVAIIVHEFSHGIQCTLWKIRIKSLGLLAFIFPVGAFVEPDEDELRDADIKRRMRVFAAGPTMNLAIALLCLFVVSFVLMPSVQPSEGAVVYSVIEGSPAQDIGLKSWCVITEINGSEIKDYKDFYYVMQDTIAGQNVSISFHDLYGKEYTRYALLADRYNYTNKTEDKGVGFLGALITDILRRDIKLFKNPFAESPRNFFVRYYGAPFVGFFIGYNPLVEPFTSYYRIEGFFSFLPSNAFWTMVNLFYWIFWLNFAVGLFNVLPILPLDGGFILQDGLKECIKKTRLSESKRERIVKILMIIVSLFTLFLLFAPLLLKYLAMLLFG